MWLVGLYSFSSMPIDDRSVLSSSSEKAQGWASAANRIHGAGQSYEYAICKIDLPRKSEKAQGWASAANRIHGAGQSYEYAICNQCSCCQSDHCELHRQVHSATDI